jgi:3-oxoadipate enol-lactonase
MVAAMPLRRGEHRPEWAPEPPVDLPPGRLVHVRGAGEFFVRDTGGDGPPVLLLHGWMFASDLNWLLAYGPLSAAGHRVLAMDHRGHGRGLRTPADFRLADCADDAAALVATLGCGPVTAVGYSMGGPIAQLMARRHPEAVSGLVMCATSTDWRALYLRGFWRSMAAIRLALGLFPTGYWRGLLRLAGTPAGQARTWMASELSRGSARDLAEAGRELGRYDGRPWLASLRTPAASVITTRDRAVPPRKQRELARALDAEVFEVRADHMASGTHPEQFGAALVAAVRAVAPGAAAAVAA